MRNTIAALAALLVALPAAAQTQVTPYDGNAGVTVTGTLTTSGDTVVLPVSGTQWATVTWGAPTTAGTATIAAEVSTDYGVNFTAAPYSRRNNVNANPTFFAFSTGNTIAAGATWETPLPSNTTVFRLRCVSSGTTNAVQIQGGTPYVPEMPVAAVLYDISTTAGANNNTPTIDVTGWRRIIVSIVTTTAATGAASLNIVDEAGAAIPVGTSASIAVGTYVFGWGDTGTFGTANPFTMAGGLTGLPLDRRLNILTTGATTSATRIRVVARR